MWGVASVLWRHSVLQRDSISTAGDSISTCGDSISAVEGSTSTVEAIQYCGGIALVLWRLFSTVEG